MASVTKEQLQQELRLAITHPSLTFWTLGLLIEKLDSDLESAKIDSLETLIVLSEHYVQSNWTKLEFQAARNLTKKDNIEVNIRF